MNIQKNGVITGKEFNESFANYTVVGNPEISEEGIYTCSYTGGNYIKIPIPNLDNFSVDIAVTISDSTQNGYYIGYYPEVAYGGMDTYWNGTGQTDCRIRVLNGTTVQSVGMNATVYQVGTNKLNLTFDGTKYVLTRTSQNGTIQTYTYESTLRLAKDFISLGRSHKSSVTATTIDLKLIVVKSYDKVVWTPSLDMSFSDYQVSSSEFYEI